MSSRTRLWVVVVSAPVIAFAVIGGFLGKAIARDEPYQHLRIFEDVVSLILNNYVEEVDVNRVMSGAMRGLAEGLDPESAYLTAPQVREVERGDRPGPADVGLSLTRQYYLRVVAARDGSPAARAGLRAGDYLRAIDGRSTRDMSVYEGRRMLLGEPGTTVKLTVIRGSAADPHELELARTLPTGADVTGRALETGAGYLRVAAVGPKTADEARRRIAELSGGGISGLAIDLRGVAGGELEHGISLARLFVSSGTLAIRAGRGSDRHTIAAAPGDGAITLPVVLLVDVGTSGAAELFAAALSSARRAELVGEKTLGRAAVQKLVKLPDGSGLWLSGTQYLTAAGAPIHGKGLEPDVDVDQPEVEFGSEAPATDATLDKALERLAVKRAA